MPADELLPWWLPMPRETRGLACHHSCCGHRRITDYEGHHHLEPPETCQGCITRDFDELAKHLAAIPKNPIASAHTTPSGLAALRHLIKGSDHDTHRWMPQPTPFGIPIMFDDELPDGVVEFRRADGAVVKRIQLSEPYVETGES